MAMTENHLDYDPEDPEVPVDRVSTTCSACTARWDERSELTDDTLILPSEVVQGLCGGPLPR